MAIPSTFIQELLARADVVDIVGRYVQLKKGGANFMGLCPFHAEKSPSFTVSPTKQFFHCFGCGKHGDAIGFLMEHTGASFVEAVQDLAQQYGLQVPEDDSTPQQRERAAAQRQKQATLSETLEKAGAAYRKHLKGSPRAIGYLKGRGLSGEIALRFGLGYAPEGWRSLASVFPSYDDPLLVESGLVISSEGEGGATAKGEAKRYDRFRDRIMFPIRNVKGECIGFGGRVLGDEKPKYLNSPETPVFSKGLELYGLYEARNAIRDAGYVLVTEGYMDVVALAQLGFPNAVATLGTACTPDHLQKLFRFTDSVVFSFDGDEAGRRASRRALEAALPYASDTRTVRFLFLPTQPKKHDPDSYIREHGREAFAHCVSEATPLSRFLIDSAREGCDLSSAEGRARLGVHAQPLWEALPDGALKRQLLGEIASLVQLDAQELGSLWADARARSQRHGAGPGPRDAGDSAARDGGTASASRSPRSPRSSEGYAAAGRGYRSQPGTGNARRGARQLPQRADHAVRLLLAHSGLWEHLSSEEHALLCGLPGQHGALLSWLEAWLHEQGPQPWAVLRQALQAHAEATADSFEPETDLPLSTVAQRLMNSDLMPTDDAAEAGQELRSLLKPMLIEQLKAEQTPDLAAHHPERYREIQERIKNLSSNAAPA
ncbi:DNA primase [Hylemonella gracilis]|uniref:DNA primase n=1 Tax=Hylemonella gracilis ATCC 19624 TaxID=887062 RepID=F3KPE9_9BURK|nr:DNA primase [Hylemonella gracilis]EGI78390.1 DNA primase [Hylemonella gracilis ATCC 19624]